MKGADGVESFKVYFMRFRVRKFRSREAGNLKGAAPRMPIMQDHGILRSLRPEGHLRHLQASGNRLRNLLRSRSEGSWQEGVTLSVGNLKGRNQSLQC